MWALEHNKQEKYNDAHPQKQMAEMDPCNYALLTSDWGSAFKSKILKKKKKKLEQILTYLLSFNKHAKMTISIFIREVWGLRGCWSGHVHDTELMCVRGGCGYVRVGIYARLLINTETKTICVQVCAPLPHLSHPLCLRNPYQQECWDCLVSSGDIMAACQMQQEGFSTSFLPVASATQC